MTRERDEKYWAESVTSLRPDRRLDCTELTQYFAAQTGGDAYGIVTQHALFAGPCGNDAAKQREARRSRRKRAKQIRHDLAMDLHAAGVISYGAWWLWMLDPQIWLWLINWILAILENEEDE